MLKPKPVPCASCGELVGATRIEYRMRRYGPWTAIHPTCFDSKLAEDPSFRELRYVSESEYLTGGEFLVFVLLIFGFTGLSAVVLVRHHGSLAMGIFAALVGPLSGILAGLLVAAARFARRRRELPRSS